MLGPLVLRAKTVRDHDVMITLVGLFAGTSMTTPSHAADLLVHVEVCLVDACTATPQQLLAAAQQFFSGDAVRLSHLTFVGTNHIMNCDAI